MWVGVLVLLLTVGAMLWWLRAPDDLSEARHRERAFNVMREKWGGDDPTKVPQRQDVPAAEAVETVEGSEHGA